MVSEHAPAGVAGDASSATIVSVIRLFDIFWHRTLGRPYRLRGVDSGGSGTSLVLLHGLAASSAVWKPLIKYLPRDEWRIFAPDLLGFGESPKPDWPGYTVDDHVQAVVAAIKRRHLKSPITLVAHSMGCLIAVRLASKYPDLVGRLVLYEPPIFADDPIYPIHMRRRGRYFAFYEYVMAHPQIALTHSRLVWRIAKRIVGLRLSEQEWIPFARSLRNTIMLQKTHQELQSIQTPTIIVEGRFDFVVVRAEVHKMFADNPFIAMRRMAQMHGLSARSGKHLARILRDLTQDKSAIA